MDAGQAIERFVQPVRVPNIADRVASRFIEARDQFKINRGWHVGPSPSIRKMLNGVKPISKGLVFHGEEKADKTYFFTDFEGAVSFWLDDISDTGEPLMGLDKMNHKAPMEFPTKDVLKYRKAILEFDLKGLTVYRDPELQGGDGAGFTTDVIPKSRVSLVAFDDYKPVIRKFAKRYHRSIKLPK